MFRFLVRMAHLLQFRADDLFQLRQTIFPVDGRPKPLAPGVTIEYTVPDMYGRPWAQIWERYFEDGMQRPDEESIFDFSR